jgi:hypothetical protein
MDQIDAIQREHLELKWMVAKLKLDLLWQEFGRKAGFNPQQPRDELGRWTNEGGNEAPGTDISSARIKGGIGKKYWEWTARQFISRFCKADINQKLPGQFEHVTIRDIIEIAKSGDKAARRCYKLLNEPRFRKAPGGEE